MNKIALLGATGSIGNSTLDVIRKNPDQYELYAATGSSNSVKMIEIVKEFNPKVVVMNDERAYTQVKEFVKDNSLKVDVLCGEEHLCAVASSEEYDSVMSAIVGAAGLKPTIAAASMGKTIYLANKEALVTSGHILLKTVHRYKAKLLPVDSEHNAIFQCLPIEEQERMGYCQLKEAGVDKILLTGSGGPFRDRDLNLFSSITPEEAVKHPNWSMGKKISVDSATMMNKGLEFIEAKWLFNCTPEDIQVVIHPESVIHSMVQYIDGSVIAQMGEPDMRTPIARAMAWPNRVNSGVGNLNFSTLKSLTFRDVDYNRYPCLKLAIEACFTSQAMTTALNAANEVAVASFLDGKIKFTDIYEICAKVASSFSHLDANDLESILEIDTQARARAFQVLCNY